MECTGGLAVPDLVRGHLGFNTTLRFRDHLAELGCLDSESKVIVTHFSHNARSLHSDLVDAFAPHQIEVAYDGMELIL